MTTLAGCRVSPFGHPGINACVPLPLAFRSLPRPSSPPCAQASPTCLHSLDYKVSVIKQSAYDLTCVTSNNLSDNLRTDSLSIRILKSAIYHYFRCQIALTLGQLGCPRARRRSKEENWAWEWMFEASDLRSFQHSPSVELALSGLPDVFTPVGLLAYPLRR